MCSVNPPEIGSGPLFRWLPISYTFALVAIFSISFSRIPSYTSWSTITIYSPKTYKNKQLYQLFFFRLLLIIYHDRSVNYVLTTFKNPLTGSQQKSYVNLVINQNNSIKKLIELVLTSIPADILTCSIVCTLLYLINWSGNCLSVSITSD